jgi:type I restriction enzyme S subunit
MRANIAAVQDLQNGDMRLDASYHASSGHQALRGLRGAGKRTDRLDQVCLSNGIFIPGRFRRVYVGNPQYGVRWLSPSDMQKADLSGLGYVSRKYTPDLDILRLQKGWILLSRSGTIGNLVYVRTDMDGLIGSDDIIRIAPNPQTIFPGYLYALLSSPAMVEVIQQKTYGAVIPHIEAHHVVDLPIPRLDSSQEEEIHRLIEQAAELRVRASSAIQIARHLVEKEVGFSSFSKRHDHAFSVEEAKLDISSPFRLDSFYYSGYCAEALKTLGKYPGKIVGAKDVGYRIYNPPLFKRQFAESGYPYMSGVDFYNLRPKTDRFLSKNQPDVDLYLVRNGTVLVQSAGQRYGLITTPLMVTHVLDGVAITSDVVRIDHKDPVENGYICSLLGSGFGRRLALRYSYGTSIPRLDVPEFSGIKIPWPEDEVRRNIGQIVVDAYQQFDLANEMEDHAQKILADTLGIAL